MPNKPKLSPSLIEFAEEIVAKCKTPDELRMALTVLIPELCGVSDQLVGRMLGRSHVTVVRLRQKFRRIFAGQKPEVRPWGGRRHGYMTIEEERQFLSGFSDAISNGGVVAVRAIKEAFESRVGRTVANTTIYRMLARHGWRHTTPKPRHPETDVEAKEGQKESPEVSAELG